MAVSAAIGIGTEGELAQLIGVKFHSVRDVVENYDLLWKLVSQLKVSPEVNHIETPSAELYLLVEQIKTSDVDPIFFLNGIDDKFEFGKTLQWNRDDCYPNQ